MLGRIRWQFSIAGVGLLVILALVGSLALSTAADAPPSGNRVYVEGVVGIPRQFNPLLFDSGSVRAERDVAALLFEGLTRPGPDGTPEPALAERWTTDETGTVWTFTLRPGLRWHDGVALAAADVEFTVRSVQDAAFPGDPALAAFWRAVDVAVLDDARVRFTLAQPYAPFLAATSLPILPQHVLGDTPPERWADAPFSREPVGTGPFRLEAFDTSEARLRPFEGAVRGRPTLDLLVLRFFASSDDARAALGRRDIHGLATVATSGLASPTDVQTRRSVPLAEYAMLEWNMRVPPLDDRRVREALVRGLDRPLLIDRVLGGHGLPLDTPWLPQTPYGGARLPSTDPAMSGRILDELGWTRGESSMRAADDASLVLPLLIVDTPAQRALADEIAQQWSALGIDVPVEAVAADVFGERMATRRFTLALRTIAPSPDPDLFAWWHSTQATAGANEAGLEDRELDRLIEQSRATLDPARRIETTNVLAERWAALLPSLPLYQTVLVYDLPRSIEPTQLDATRLLATPSARFDSISAWTFAEQ